MVIVCGLTLCCSSAFALNTGLDLSQYMHSAWRNREGFVRGGVLSISQTTDGYLWLGTEFGLWRFDGVRAVPWVFPGERLKVVGALLTARDGTLWIGGDHGMASWKDGRFRRFETAAQTLVNRIVEDRHGSIWFTAFSNRWVLCRIDSPSVTCFGQDGGPGIGAIGLYEDGAGQLWVGTPTGVWRWQPGPPTFYPLPEQEDGYQGLSQSRDGALLLSAPGSVRRLVDGRLVIAHAYPGPVRLARSQKMLRDRDGGLWIGTSANGLIRVRDAITDVFTTADGLSADAINFVFEDREGNIWVGTFQGLDRFREPVAASYSAAQGLSNSRVASALASADGAVWLATPNGLNRLADGELTIYRDRRSRNVVDRAPLRSRTVREVDVGAISGGVMSIFQDSQERVWVSTRLGVGYLRDSRFVTISNLPGGVTRAIAEARDQAVWIVNQASGLFRVGRGATQAEHITPEGLNRRDAMTAMAFDSDDALWLGFYEGGIVRYASGRVQAYGIGEGISDGRVSALYFDRFGKLWIATSSGLTRLSNSRGSSLTSSNGLPCDGVSWVIEDDAEALWIGTDCGLVRIDRVAMEAWTAAVDSSAPGTAAPSVTGTVFDHGDGIMTFAGASYVTSPVAKSRDGRLWFVSQEGVTVIDPARLPVNTLRSPVHIEAVIADRTSYFAGADPREPVNLPPLVRDLRIDYTALSLVSPETTRFRYKLEGHDRDWQDVGTRRQAFYNDLPPGRHHFLVTATNNSGVWNEDAASLDFIIAPAYYQTTWFRFAMIGTVMLSLTVFYRLRARQLARQLSIRFEERLAERTRIARDLHDTLLQSFQGVLLKFQATAFLLPDRPADARASLERVIEQASQAIAEGRDAVQGLRSSVVARSDLVRALMTVGEGLAVDHAGEDAPKFRMYVEGAARELAPMVADEVYRIAVEALRNCFKHARALNIELELHYGADELRVRVRDDGCGIDRAVLTEGGRTGHYGLPGMHERATVIRGKLAVWSQLQSGTEVALTVPGPIAYAKSQEAVSGTRR